jgi:hypothetical protein
MDLSRMLDKCHRGQWSLGDIDWSAAPRPMSPGEEVVIVQYFTNMAGIERLAKALFVEQRRRAGDPLLAEIFATFITDEERHACAAERLAAHYNVHRRQRYELHPALVRFQPAFIDAIRYLSAEFANLYITSGELLLDIALLRGLSDYVADPTCDRVMGLINRDESRHIAMDYYMTGYYAAPERVAELRRQRRPPGYYAAAAAAFAKVLYRAAPFIRKIFVEPLRLVDPSDRHMREAFKRIQLLGRKPEVARRPFARFLRALQRGYNTPVAGALFGRAISRVIGVPGEVLVELYSDAEARRAAGMSYGALANEALAVKHARVARGTSEDEKEAVGER